MYRIGEKKIVAVAGDLKVRKKYVTNTAKIRSSMPAIPENLDAAGLHTGLGTNVHEM